MPADNKIQRSGDPQAKHFVNQEEIQAWLDDLDTRKPGLGRIVLKRALSNGIFSPNGEYLAREWLDSHPARDDRRVLPDRRAKRRWSWRFWDGKRMRTIAGRRSSDTLGFLPSRNAILTTIGTVVIVVLLAPAFQTRKPPAPIEIRQHPMEPREPIAETTTLRP